MENVSLKSCILDKLIEWAKEFRHGVYSEKRTDIIDDIMEECGGSAKAPKDLIKVKPVAL